MYIQEKRVIRISHLCFREKRTEEKDMKKNKKTTDEHNDSDFNNLIKPFMIRVVCKI